MGCVAHMNSLKYHDQSILYGCEEMSLAEITDLAQDRSARSHFINNSLDLWHFFIELQHRTSVVLYLVYNAKHTYV